MKDRKGIMMAEAGEKKESFFGGFFSNMFGGEEDSPDKGRVVVSVSFLMALVSCLVLKMTSVSQDIYKHVLSCRVP